VDPAILGVALPLSGKGSPGGMGVLPRGSVSPVEGNLLRFFAYWRERAKPTDYDLSVLMLDATYGNPATSPRPRTGPRSSSTSACPPWTAGSSSRS
jgi:hypothetical protein